MVSLHEEYGHKIKTRNELREIIGPFPRERSVIMCHGVFDVVHPGHVRHLVFAKSRADILVVSLTADRHIAKGIYRPHIPQDLRAGNLAAFEVVDYVIVDDNPTPLENIAFLQPDYFAKGYEYVSDGVKPKTAEESTALKSYGGELIFTPGDIVYSSTNLIELAPPAIPVDKLVTLMHVEGIGFDQLHAALDGFAGKRVHVLGDTIVDSYTRTTLIGGKTKTPTMSVLFDGQTDYVGGAGVVAKHIRAAGADVTLSTVLGDDPLKEFVLEDLRSAGVRCNAVIDAHRPTTQKNAIIAGGYHLLKIDTLDNSTITDSVLAALTASLVETRADAVAFCDFRHGIFNRRTIGPLIDAIPEGVFKVADSQVASRWGNITDFKGFDLLTPNEREARFALADQDSGVRTLLSDLCDATDCKTLMLKLGDRGMMTARSGDHVPPDSFIVVDSFANDVVDAVGAGDALLAYATLSMLATGNEVIATIVGSLAAACECERDGNIPVTREDVADRIRSLEDQVNFR